MYSSGQPHTIPAYNTHVDIMKIKSLNHVYGYKLCDERLLPAAVQITGTM